MNKYRIHRSVPRLLAACAAALLCGAAAANPTGAVVANGQVTFNTNGNTLTVTNSPNSIINWQGFSISAGELTRFVQQTAASAVLNRVVSVAPSSILGMLQSNGRVFLVNPNGIVFGAGSQVDVGGLVASTLNISNSDFLAGSMRFTEVPGAGGIVSQGSIAAQNGVYLIAPNITISGSITSTQGSIVLAAGQTVDIAESSAGNANSASVTGNGTETISLLDGVIAGGNIILTVFTAPSSFGNACLASLGSGCGSGTIPIPPLLTLLGTPIINSTSGSTGNINLGGNLSLNTPVNATGGNIQIGASGGAITLANTGTGSGSQAPQFVFGDTSKVKVVETRDAAGTITGWFLASQ